MTFSAWMGALAILEIVVVFSFVLTERRHPSATLAWVFAVIFIPVAGLLAYLVLGRTHMVRRSRRSKRLSRTVRELMRRHGVISAEGELPQCRPEVMRLVRMAARMGVSPATDGNRSTLLVNAVEAYAAMFTAMDSAKHHIHIEFYIWRDDDTGRRFRDALVAKARQGVRVRALVDAVGSASLPDDFFKPLTDAGGAFEAFAPITRLGKLLRRGRIDFRNHRKILVVDGRVGFTGGINLGDEYLGLSAELGLWRDTHVALEGPAVLGLQKAFVEDWLWVTELLLEEPELFPRFEDRSGDVVLVVESGPDREWTPIHRIYVQAIGTAARRVWLTNPYFLPDKVMEEALVSAALRGVDVRVLLPLKNDSMLVEYASAAFFEPLLAAGVKLYRYRAGFVHAKTLVVDDWGSTVGSANLDARSFRINFELNAFIFGEELAAQLADAFEADLREADAVSRDDERAVGYVTRVGRSVAQLMSPLL